MYINQLCKFLLDAGSFAYNPESAMRKYQKKLGDPFRFQMSPKQSIWVSGTPMATKEIFTAKPEIFGPLAADPIESLMGPKSLLILEGQNHLREKVTMSPAFQGDNMRLYGETMQFFALHEFNHWKSDQAHDIYTAMKHITLNVILSAIFGIQDKELLEIFRKKTMRFLTNYSPSLMFLPILRNRFWYPWQQYINAREEFDNLMLEQIEKCRINPEENRNDILFKFVNATFSDGSQFSNESLLDELKTLLVGGHETSSTALTWALYYIFTNDDIKNKLLSELNSLPEDAGIAQMIKLPYLTAVCQEALRIHPTVPIILRTLKEPFEFRGKALNPGDTIALSLTLLHSNEDTWEHPHLFNPERFLNRTYSQYEFAPFGGGVRRCLGASFALYEIKIILAVTLLNIKLKIKPQKNIFPHLYGMIMKPRKNIWGTVDNAYRQGSIMSAVNPIEG